MEPRPLLTDLGSDGKWIMSSGKNVLWLPEEYRFGEYIDYIMCKSVCGTKVAVATRLGKVWICSYTGSD